MTAPGREAAITAELDMVEEELDVAEAAVDRGRHRVALTRVYFAAFHLARALVYSVDQEPRTPAGVLHLFNLHWVMEGRAPVRFNALLSRLQKYREEADYAAFYPVDEDWVRQELERVGALRDFALEALGRRDA